MEGKIGFYCEKKHLPIIFLLYFTLNFLLIRRTNGKNIPHTNTVIGKICVCECIWKSERQIQRCNWMCQVQQVTSSNGNKVKHSTLLHLPHTGIEKKNFYFIQSHILMLTAQTKLTQTFGLHLLTCHFYSSFITLSYPKFVLRLFLFSFSLSTSLSLVCNSSYHMFSLANCVPN